MFAALKFGGDIEIFSVDWSPCCTTAVNENEVSHNNVKMAYPCWL